MNKITLLMRRFGFLMLLLVTATAMSACEADEPEYAPEEEVVTDPNAGTDYQNTNGELSVADIDNNAAQYMGQTVTVKGEVDDVYGQSSFKIDGGVLQGELLIIVPSNVTITGLAAGSMLEDDDEVRVMGTVREYILADIETEFGLDLDGETEVEYEDREPVVVATSIEVIDADDDILDNDPADEDNL